MVQWVAGGIEPATWTDKGIFAEYYLCFVENLATEVDKRTAAKDYVVTIIAKKRTFDTHLWIVFAKDFDKGFVTANLV